MTGPLVILRLSDGKRGHDNQSLGLVEALARYTPVDSHDLTLTGQACRIIRQALLGRLPPGIPIPQLVIAAGHSTHLPLLATARCGGARSIVLMKPDLPLACFSYCLIPEHDNVAKADNVLTTRGALNRISPGNRRTPDLGLILIGGPSRHHHWDTDTLVEKIRRLVTATGNIHWHVGGSRRTPADTLQILKSLPGVEVYEAADTTDDWVPTMLATATQVWVSADSVSMAYEAASSGAATGILEVPTRATGSRVERALSQLLDSKLAISFTQWQAGQALCAPAEPLSEANRCARWILQRLHDGARAEHHE